MTGEETGSFLRHHLAMAGRSDTLFSDDATALIDQTSRGYPRAVSNLALQTLVVAFAADRPSPTSPPPAPPSPKSPPNDRLAPRHPADHGAIPPTGPSPGTPPAGPRHTHDVCTVDDAAVCTLEAANRGRQQNAASDPVN